ncbi:MAG TPA: lysozyme inhibitor LprI family protein [Xanthobacteraceae bacterium]
MKFPITVAFALTFSLLLSLLAGRDAAAVTCAGPTNADGLCLDPELVALHRAGDVKLKRLAAAADPLTALLLRRDQRWFIEVVHGDGDEVSSGSKDDPGRLRMKALLEGRLATLDRLAAGAAPEDARGEWLNALGRAKVEKHGDGLTVDLVANPDYDFVQARCGMTARVTLRPDGWYVGTPVPKALDDQGAQSVSSDAKDNADPRPSAQGGKAELRLRLQGNALRVVLIRDAEGDYEPAFCNVPEMITGSYFPVGPRSGHAGDPATRTVLPSFDCATAKNLDAEEICADPDLARLDGEIARTYRDTLRRLDAKLAAHLRDDQRAWLKSNAGAFDIFLHPYWDKRNYQIHQTGNVRSEWETRMRERLAMLANIDETRRGLAGHWIAYNAMLALLPDPDEHDGSASVEGGKWVTGSHKQYCDFDGEGRIVGNRFKPDADDLPKLRREGATLTVDGDDPDPDRKGDIDRKQPKYCTRLNSAKARLFPVKPAAHQGKYDDRIR